MSNFFVSLPTWSILDPAKKKGVPGYPGSQVQTYGRNVVIGLRRFGLVGFWRISGENQFRQASVTSICPLWVFGCGLGAPAGRTAGLTATLLEKGPTLGAAARIGRKCGGKF